MCGSEAQDNPNGLLQWTSSPGTEDGQLHTECGVGIFHTAHSPCTVLTMDRQTPRLATHVRHNAKRLLLGSWQVTFIRRNAAVVAICASYSKRGRQKRHLQWFFSPGPLKFVLRDILGPLPQMENRTVIAIMTKDRCSGITRSVFTSRKTATTIKNVFLYQWIVLNGIHEHLLIDNGTKLLIKFLAAICGFLGLTHLTTTVYHP